VSEGLRKQKARKFTIRVILTLLDHFSGSVVDVGTYMYMYMYMNMYMYMYVAIYVACKYGIT